MATQLKGDVPYYSNWIDKMDRSVLAIVVNAEKRVVDMYLMKYKIVQASVKR